MRSHHTYGRTTSAAFVSWPGCLATPGLVPWTGADRDPRSGPGSSRCSRGSKGYANSQPRRSSLGQGAWRRQDWPPGRERTAIRAVDPGPRDAHVGQRATRTHNRKLEAGDRESRPLEARRSLLPVVFRARSGGRW